MSKKNSLNFTPEMFKLNSNFYLDQGFFEKESHFEKSSEISNFEVTVFLNRLIGVFDVLMTKLEFAATLPFILSHPRVLEILKTQDLKQIVSAFVPFSYFRNSSEETSLLQSLEEGDLQTSESSVEVKSQNDKDCSCSHASFELCGSVKDNASVYSAVHILHSYPLIRQLAKESQNDIPKSTLNFLRQIKYLMEFVISKVELLPVEERDRELHIRQVCSKIKQSKDEISELTKSLEDQKLRHRTEANELSDQVTILMETWRSINDEFNSQLTKTLKDSEDNLAKSLAEFNERMENHQSTLDKLKMKVENEKAENRKKEHEVQGKKFKVESQLSSLIMKFDTEVSDRQQYYEELMKEYDALEKERLQLMDDMDKQLNIYDNIMEEKEEKEFAAYKEKYTNFVNNRCAKLIQRWWRNVCAKKKKKGKKKKNKPKK
ncbi:dynein regulatory complex protein 10-like [Nasonia vitripennis]|uniref:Dynein regulatory complex protein 10 n=1 Tax=Nasonia vitripennis TaxID=7425 RepID=A0A7M7LNS4_NASVI|nr:dynein regulatory complex protein 10-like [Nasonia vitripennis]